MAAAITPVINDKGEVVALVEADILMPYIRSGALNILIALLASLFFIMVFVMLMLYVYVRGKIITPLLKLSCIMSISL